MGRIRSVHPEQWTDAEFVSCSPLARLLAIALRNEADDRGIFEWKPVKLKMVCLPADNCDINTLLSELISSDQVTRYEAAGRQYGLIRNFTKFQKPKSPHYRHPTPPGFPKSPQDERSEFPQEFGNCGSDGIGEDIGGEGDSPPVAPHDPESEFREWYSQYPRKVDPGRAAKAYRAARKIASAADLLAGALRYSAECDGKDPQYIKHPATWLNARSWLNEPEPSRPSNGKSPTHGSAKLSHSESIFASFAIALGDGERQADCGADRDLAGPLLDAGDGAGSPRPFEP